MKNNNNEIRSLRKQVKELQETIDYYQELIGQLSGLIDSLRNDIEIEQHYRAEAIKYLTRPSSYEVSKGYDLPDELSDDLPF